MPDNQPPLPRHEAKKFEKWLKDRAKVARASLALSSAAGALDGALLVGQIWVFAQVLSHFVLHIGVSLTILRAAAVLIALAVLRAACQRLSQQQAMRAALQTRRHLRASLNRHAENLRDRAIAGEGSGAIAHLMTDGLDAIDGYYTAYLPKMKIASMIPVIVLIAATPIDWVSALIMAATAPIMPVFMVLVGKGAEQASLAQWQRLAQLSARFYDALEGMTTLKIFGAVVRETQTLARLSEDYRRSTMTVLRAAFLSSLVLEFFATISIAMIAVYVGFRLYAGTLHYQAGLFVLLLAPEFYRPLRNMSAHYHARTEAITAASRIVDILGADHDETNANLYDSVQRAGPMPMPMPMPITLQDVSVAQSGRGMVIEHLSASLPTTGLTALTGPTGSGKTSLLRAILGLQPLAGGQVMVGNSVLMQDGYAAWHRRVSWLPQAPTILHDTIAANLRLARPEATEAMLWSALHQAQAHRFVENLSDGLQTVVGGKKTALSGGEMRRLVLARALVKDSDVLILDEPTAHLDPQNASEIVRSIAALSRDRLVIAATHDAALMAIATVSIPLRKTASTPNSDGATIQEILA